MLQVEIWEKIIIPLLSALAGTLLGGGLTFFYQKKFQKHNDKKLVLATLMGYRYAAYKEPDFVKALNMVDIVFHDNRKVKDLLHKYFLYTGSEIYSGGTRVETFFDMLLEMGRDIGYKDLRHSDIHDFYNPAGMQNPPEDGRIEP